jgi:hypothetical protein
MNVTGFRYDVEVAGVSGDIAYTAGFERFDTRIGDNPIEHTDVRVTHVYRSERRLEDRPPPRRPRAYGRKPDRMSDGRDQGSFSASKTKCSGMTAMYGA